MAATNGIAPQEQGLAGGLLNTSFQFGGALALAVVTAVINSGDGVGPPRRPRRCAAAGRPRRPDVALLGLAVTMLDLRRDAVPAAVEVA